MNLVEFYIFIAMTLNECLSKRQLLQETDSVTFKYQKMSYTIHIGDTLNRLTVAKIVQYFEGSTKRWGAICKCTCGNYIGPLRCVSLINGDSMSCGCLQRELHSQQLAARNYRHGCATRDSRERLYVLWGAMKDRASNVNRRDSKWYAKKHLEFYEEWHDYTKFKEWALSHGYKEGLSIDRIDNSIGYIPSNCHWIPVKEQNKNKTSNRLITFNGRTQILADWCREQQLDDKLVSSRLSRGWSELEALELI